MQNNRRLEHNNRFARTNIKHVHYEINIETPHLGPSVLRLTTHRLAFNRNSRTLAFGGTD